MPKAERVSQLFLRAKYLRLIVHETHEPEQSYDSLIFFRVFRAFRGLIDLAF